MRNTTSRTCGIFGVATYQRAKNHMPRLTTQELMRARVALQPNIDGFSHPDLVGLVSEPGSGAFEEVDEPIGPELIDLDIAIDEAEHDNRPFRAGDEVLQLRDCSGSKEGHRYTLVEASDGLLRADAGNGQGCTCPQNRRHAKPLPTIPCKKCKQPGAKFKGGFCKKCNSIAF